MLMTYDTVQVSTYFKKLDLLSGYHHIRITENDIQKTAINTPRGYFRFRVMGFDLANAC